jgi:hypothetical protein
MEHLKLFEEFNNINEELSNLQIEYRKYFQFMLKCYKVKSPSVLPENKKKEFFDNIKKYWVKGQGATKDLDLIKKDILKESLNEEFFVDDFLDKTMDGIDKLKVSMKKPALRRIIAIIQNDAIVANYINNGNKFDFAESDAYPGYLQSDEYIVKQRLREILNNKDYWTLAQNADYVNKYLNLNHQQFLPVDTD